MRCKSLYPATVSSWRHHPVYRQLATHIPNRQSFVPTMWEAEISKCSKHRGEIRTSKWLDASSAALFATCETEGACLARRDKKMFTNRALQLRCDNWNARSAPDYKPSWYLLRQSRSCENITVTRFPRDKTPAKSAIREPTTSSLIRVAKKGAAWETAEVWGFLARLIVRLMSVNTNGFRHSPTHRDPPESVARAAAGSVSLARCRNCKNTQRFTSR